MAEYRHLNSSKTDDLLSEQGSHRITQNNRRDYGKFIIGVTFVDPWLKMERKVMAQAKESFSYMAVTKAAVSRRSTVSHSPFLPVNDPH